LLAYLPIAVLLVLTAINEDSPTVPALLTDYILNGVYLYALFYYAVLHFSGPLIFTDNGTVV